MLLRRRPSLPSLFPVTSTRTPTFSSLVVLSRPLPSFRSAGGTVRSNVLALELTPVLYTGSGQVGKIVATAAAQTLTSTTLELGGKSPVIIAPDADLKITARRMLSMKQLGVGQVRFRM